MAFEKYILPVGNQPKIALHLLRSLLEHYLDVDKTGAETKAEIERVLDTTLSTNEALDLTDILAYISAGSDLFDKKNRMDKFYRILISAEHGSYWPTQELLRNKLNWSVEA